MSRDVLITVALGRLATIFHLCEIYCVIFFRNNIYLADAGLPVAANNLMTVLFQMVGNDLLGG